MAQTSTHESFEAARWMAKPHSAAHHVPWMQLGATLVSLFATVPVGFIVWIAWQTGWETSASLIFRPRVAELLWNTALLVVFAVPVSMALAILLAWLTERSDLPGRRVWAWFCIAPLAVPAFVHSYAWVTLIPGLEGPFAGVLISVVAYFPFLYLPVAATFRRLAMKSIAATSASRKGVLRRRLARRASKLERHAALSLCSRIGFIRKPLRIFRPMR